MMKRTWGRFICVLTLAVFTVLAACAEGTIVINEDLSSLTQEETLEMLSEVTEEYYQDPDIAAELEQEIGMRQIGDPYDEDEGKVMNLGTVVHEGHTMQCLMDVIGELGENGKYPLYITLHGGGEGEPEGNDSQWSVSSFYWLKADPSVTAGLITAFLNGDNAITVYPEDVSGDFSILVNPALLDVSRPIQITTPEGEFEVRVNPSRETMYASILETGDPTLAWVAEIPYSSLSASN